MILLLLSLVIATPQNADKIQYGDHAFTIRETPMLGLWYYGDANLPPGKVRPPKFSSVDSSNWSGYRAKWLIKDSKLYLKKITGKIDGKNAKNEEIIKGKQFPLQAVWFSGRIHVPVGGVDDDSNKMLGVIVFEINKGIVTATKFHPELTYSYGWNGLPSKSVIEK